MQQYVSLDISLPKIVPLQNDNKASKIMFLANQNDKAKIMPEKPKTKQTCNSAFHYALLFQKLYFYKATPKH